MDLKQVAKDTSKTLIGYLTYQAVRIIMAQLSETNPPLAYWLNNFSTKSKIQDGDAYLEELLREKQDLAFRVMTVRQYLAEEVTDFLPEMVRTGIQQKNMEHQRRHLERMTQLTVSDPAASPESQVDPPAESDLA
uniref:RuBisCO chaperone RbcX n=5 Tax=Cephalothrix komarekiana TaxID=1844524 RepID=A0A0A0QQC0_9CYAN|nr:chaperonin-like protein [Cephalothrix komarekiana CCIBt 3277]AIS72684.1 chaperonin-like protein [Cephalothrix komarekiana CCIBt 3279]AIS72687.1 chaperonin-like protein [Cephalothrix komarekiana CCIBt 3523]AIS72689.1 chaperonin-like protein [Cephalothrix komarekiana SAG 75.79]AIS72692.1 chaperonin-like protein [Cephalothrix komarekiana UTEX 1580]